MPHPGRPVREPRFERSPAIRRRCAFDRQEAGDARPAEPTWQITANRDRDSIDTRASCRHHRRHRPSRSCCASTWQQCRSQSAAVSHTAFWRAAAVECRVRGRRCPFSFPHDPRKRYFVFTVHARCTRQEKSSIAGPPAFYSARWRRQKKRSSISPYIRSTTA